MQFGRLCLPWKCISLAKNPVLQTLQFKNCRKFLGAVGISHFGRNEFCFDQMNVCTSLPSFG